jgi:ABC-type sulfate transport system substrate-binding protein
VKSINLKVIVEAVGIVAIVVSLTFVGLQMRQSQEIAIAETFLSILSSEIELYNAINEHVDLWEKANGGEELTGSEARIFENLVASLNIRVSRSRAQLNRLGHANAARDQVVDFASFLYQNPAARKVWASLWETRLQHRGVTGGYQSPFPQEVLGHLESLDRMGQ